MTNAGWGLGRFLDQDDPSDGLRLEVDRPLLDAERTALFAATRVVGAMTGHYLIGPFMNSANRLAEVAHHILERPSERTNDMQFQIELSMALDEWLSQLNMLRRRTEREVRLVLGEDAGRGAETLFRRLWGEVPTYRLCWEWRNAAQHAINPASVTHITGRSTSNGPVKLWTLQRDQLLTLDEVKWPFAVDSVAEEVDCLELVGQVVDACNVALCQIFVDNEDALEGAALTLLTLATEYHDKPGTAIAIKIMEDPQDPKRQDWSLHPIRSDLAGHVAAGLDGAREHLGLPRKWTDDSEGHDDGESSN